MSHQGIHYTLLDATLGENNRFFHQISSWCILWLIEVLIHGRTNANWDEGILHISSNHPSQTSESKIGPSSRIKPFSRYHTHVYFLTDYTESALDTQKTQIMEPMQLTPPMLAEINHISERMEYISENIFSPKMSAIVLRKAACCQTACTCSAVDELNLHKENLENILSNTDLQE